MSMKARSAAGPALSGRRRKGAFMNRPASPTPGLALAPRHSSAMSSFQRSGLAAMNFAMSAIESGC